jgi:hypothetical protein
MRIGADASIISQHPNRFINENGHPIRHEHHDQSGRSEQVAPDNLKLATPERLDSYCETGHALMCHAAGTEIEHASS